MGVAFTIEKGTILAKLIYTTAPICLSFTTTCETSVAQTLLPN